MSINLDNLVEQAKVDDYQELSNQKQSLEGYENQLVGVMSVIHNIKNSITQIQRNIAEREVLKAQNKFQEYKEMSEEHQQVTERLEGFSDQIKEQKEHVASLEEVLAQAEEEVQLKEDLKMLEITNAVDDDGKKKYKNDTARNAALGKWKQHDLDYQETLDEAKQAKRELDNAKFELDRLYNEMKNYHKISDMISARMAMLG